MISRCYQPGNASYSEYGGRGILVADEWRGRSGFERFLAHIGPAPSERHTIDRIKNERGYEPGNVRWATHIEQVRNTRSNRTLTAFGRTMCQLDWSRETGLDEQTIARRLARGWSHEDVLSTPRWQRTPRSAA